MAKLESCEFVKAGRFRTGRRGKVPTMIVLHWSAGFGNAAEIADYFINPHTKQVVTDEAGNPVIDPKTKKPKVITKPRNASYHFAIGRAGELVQLVDTDNTAWHAGGGLDWHGEGRVNERSIGVCLANRGPLYKDPGYVKTHPDRLFIGPHTKPGFHAWGDKFEVFPEEQVETLKQLLEVLVKLHPTLSFVCGHEDLVGGKGDPGPALTEHAIDWGHYGLVRQVKDWSTNDWSALGAIDA